MNGDSILLVEDDKEIRQGVEIFLRSQGYQVFQAENGLEGLKILEERPIDLAIVDVMMPVMDGITMTAKLREKYDFPVIFLSAKTEEVDKILGLNIGADDYVTKPISTKVIILKIKKLLKIDSTSFFYLDKMSFDYNSFKLTINDKELILSKREALLLEYFFRNQNIVLSRETLLNEVWGFEFSGEERAVDTLVTRLRKKMGVYAEYIKSIRGVGYVFNQN